MGHWLLRTVCMQIQAWQQNGIAPPKVAVNLSAREIKHTELIHVLTEIFRDTGVAPECLELEITEELMCDGGADTISVLFALKKLGMPLAVDDFGSSASSLRCLRRLRVDTLKIDRQLIDALHKNNNKRTILR